jgi:hypothetical protein
LFFASPLLSLSVPINAAAFTKPRRQSLRRLLPLVASSAISADRLPHRAIRSWNGCGQVRLAQILDLFGEDSWRSVHAGELEVRPPLGRTGVGLATYQT